MTDRTDTPAAALAAATQRGVLPTSRLVLLGTMHGPSSGRALVRYAGKVYQLEVGDRVDRGIVVAIGEGVIILNRGGRAERLRLPAK